MSARRADPATAADPAGEVLEPGEPLTALVLAGGEARRLGGHKADRRLDDRTLLEHALALAAAVAVETILLPRERPHVAPAGVRVVPDWPGAPGPLAALGAGLEAARTRWCVLLACDMPLLTPAVVRELARRAASCEAEALAATTPCGWEPFAGLYRARLAPRVAALRAAGTGSLHALLDAVGARGVPAESLRPLDPELRFLHNVNTRDDLALARRKAAPAHGPAPRTDPAGGASPRSSTP